MDIISKSNDIEPKLVPVDETMNLNPHNNYLSYDDIIQSYKFEIIDEADIGSYQGDMIYILYDNITGKYGWLTFGYGSCSGCDMLQGCEDEKDVIDLRQGLFEDISWKRNKEELLDYLNNHDWEGDWIWHEPEFRTALASFKNKLK